MDPSRKRVGGNSRKFFEFLVAIKRENPRENALIKGEYSENAAPKIKQQK